VTDYQNMELTSALSSFYEIRPQLQIWQIGIWHIHIVKWCEECQANLWNQQNFVDNSFRAMKKAEKGKSKISGNQGTVLFYFFATSFLV